MIATIESAGSGLRAGQPCPLDFAAGRSHHGRIVERSRKPSLMVVGRELRRQGSRSDIPARRYNPVGLESLTYVSTTRFRDRPDPIEYVTSMRPTRCKS